MMINHYKCDRVTELGNTHTQSCVATAGVHAQLCREICNGGRSTATVAAHTHPHSNHTRRGGGGGGGGHAEEVESTRNKGADRSSVADGTPRGNQQQPTTSWRARTASAHGAEATVATIHSHTSIARASAPEECVRDGAAEGGGHTHIH